MTLTLEQLNDDIRQAMQEELALDVEREAVHLPEVLGSMDLETYVGLLRQAFAYHGPDWLGRALGDAGEWRIAGRTTRVDPNVGASEGENLNAQALAEGEFNRYCARGFASYALASGLEELEVYQVAPLGPGHVVYSREGITQVAGAKSLDVADRVDAQDLLELLRGLEPGQVARGIPGAPDSGLAVRIPKTF